MEYEEYSAEELNNSVDKLINVHKDKLKDLEVKFLYSNRLKLDHNVVVPQNDRDIIIAMYDRMGEASY